MTETTWPTDWLRGVLPLAVMGVLVGGPTYGYAISRRLADAGIGAVKGGTLYPLLQRLESDGLVRSQWQQGDSGPGRKYFHLTDVGVAECASRREAWVRFTGAVIDLISNEEVHDECAHQESERDPTLA